MGANTSNALFYLVSTLFEVYMWIIMLRILLQMVRADFYNPISQLIWQFTQPLLRPVQSLLPKVRQWDLAAIALLVVVALAYINAIAAITGYGDRYGGLDSLLPAFWKLITMALNLYTFSLVIQAVLSWVGPGVNNPAGSILWSINEPLLRPVRRVIPPFSGLDLSPLVVIVLLQTVNLMLPLPGIFR